MGIGDIVIHRPKVNIYDDIIGKVCEIKDDEVLLEFKYSDMTMIKAFDIKEVTLIKGAYRYDN